MTLPVDVLERIDRCEKNRSRFVLEAVERELEHRRREDLRRSLESPHPESAELEPLGFEDWARSLPDEADLGLLDRSGGTPVRWVPGEGWVEERT